MSQFTKALIDIPVLTRLWSKYPRTWKYLLNIGLLLKYKTFHFEKLPTRIKLPSSFELHINSRENRGRALLISNGITQLHVTSFWEKSIKEFSPTTVLDIGVNYGECLFSVSYPTDTKIYGIEANEQLMPFIEKSLACHPNQRNITIIHAFASSQEKQTQEFYVDTNWSGTSSGKQIYSETVEKYMVQTITVDSLFQTHDLSHEKILFKIDVEGFEAFVLEGMKQVIQNCKDMLGIIEFDSVYIQNAGTDIDTFLDILSKNFHVYIMESTGAIQLLSQVTMDKLQKTLHSKEIHTDLVLATKELDFFPFKGKD
ncbi:FkbM family methyltransferase [Fredinandcohnia humi]